MTGTWIMRELAQAGASWVTLEVLRATLVLLAAIALASLMRRSSAGSRHLVWAAGVVALLGLPVMTGLLPWQLAIVPVDAPVVTAPASSTSTSDPVPAPPLSVPAPQAADAGIPEGDVLASAPSPSLADRAPDLALPTLLVIWVLGAALLLVRLFAGWLSVRRVLRDARPLNTPEWTRPLLEGADRMELGDVPAIVASARTTMPFACGLVRATIVLPAVADEWSDERRRAVLLHELAHVRRNDVPLNLLGRIACALYWFHPLVWVVARQLRAESERACDDLVLSTGARPSSYADHLLQIACRAGRERIPAVALPMAQRREFEGRMLAILESGVRRRHPTRRVAGAAAAAAFVMALPLAALAPASRGDSGSLDPQSNDVASMREDTADTGDDLDAQHDADHDVDEPGSIDARAELADDGTSQETTQETAGWAQENVQPAQQDGQRAWQDAQRVQQQWQEPQRQQQNAHQSRGADPVAALLRLLREDTDAQVRSTAAWSLAEFDDPRAVPGLAEALVHDANASVRATAAWALGEIGDEAAAPALASALGDDDAEVRLRAAWAFGQIAPERAPAALMRAAEDAEGRVSVAAIWALGQIEDPAAVPVIGRALETSDDPAVRRVALWAVGSIGGETAGALLLRLLDDPDPAVRAAAARGLAGAGPGPWPWPWPMPGGPH